MAWTLLLLSQAQLPDPPCSSIKPSRGGSWGNSTLFGCRDILIYHQFPLDGVYCTIILCFNGVPLWSFILGRCHHIIVPSLWDKLHHSTNFRLPPFLWPIEGTQWFISLISLGSPLVLSMCLVCLMEPWDPQENWFFLPQHFGRSEPFPNTVIFLFANQTGAPPTPPIVSW